MSGSFPHYDVVMAMTDYCTVRSTTWSYQYSLPRSISSRECVTFMPATEDEKNKLVHALMFMYGDLGIPTVKRMDIKKRITICKVGKRWTAYMGRAGDIRKNSVELLYPVPLEYVAQPSRLMRDAGASSASFDTARDILVGRDSHSGDFRPEPTVLPKAGTLVNEHDKKELDGLSFQITRTASGRPRGQLTLYVMSEQRIEPIIADPYINYTDDMPPFRSATLSLPSLPLLYSAGDECWRLIADDDDENVLEDSLVAASLVFGLSVLSIRDIGLCFLNSVWQLQLGPTKIAMEYSRTP
ncbi:hypothetical protein FOZ63_019070 [Perkinsus olseni]|uniref:Uncharacterized protein n=1 Tax=Perkinsus olseni TaxID=32597 RepID=A0A7J6PUZ0_PEROL|nr:hypothetical protein FOZ63_019070 [Perkinsus olseni]